MKQFVKTLNKDKELAFHKINEQNSIMYLVFIIKFFLGNKRADNYKN